MKLRSYGLLKNVIAPNSRAKRLRHMRRAGSETAALKHVAMVATERRRRAERRLKARCRPTTPDTNRITRCAVRMTYASMTFMLASVSQMGRNSCGCSLPSVNGINDLAWVCAWYRPLYREFTENTPPPTSRTLADCPTQTLVWFTEHHASLFETAQVGRRTIPG